MKTYLESAARTIQIEQDAIGDLRDRLNDEFVQACELLANCPGRVIVMGMGKSGHIANKIAATLASTGTPAFFVHPAEASHGDLGMITKEDVVLAISNSGNTSEIVTIIPLIKRMGTPLISMTGNPTSVLASEADFQLDISIKQEACPLGLAPTTSTTVSLVMGDAIAVALLEAKGFSEEDFAFSHPGGALGRKLLLKVSDLMHIGDRIPKVSPDTPLTEGLFEITKKGLGLTAIVGDSDNLLGLFTDGDLRRALENQVDLHATSIQELMTPNCKTIQPEALAAEALNTMEVNKITGLLVVNEQGQLVGVIHMHDLLRAGVI